MMNKEKMPVKELSDEELGKIGGGFDGGSATPKFVAGDQVTWTTIAGGTDLSSGRILSCDGFNSTAGDITYAVAEESGLLEGIITHLGERRLTLQ